VWLPDKLITAIAEGPAGEIFVGTSQGLYRFDGRIVTAITRRDGLSNDWVLSISVDGAGAVWAGTKAGGLDRIVGRKAVRLPARGMSALAVFSVIDDGHGGLWMGTPRGVLRAPRSELIALSEGRRSSIDLTMFDKSDGMRASECVGLSRPPAALAKDGSVWFATAMGFAHTNPARSQGWVAPPPLRLTSVTFDHLPRPVAPNLAIPAGTGEVDFEFDAVRLASPDRLLFRYKLENYDTDWTETRSRRVFFRRLPAGTYRLLASVRDQQGPWSENTSIIAVRQLPYFYQQWWFYLLLVALATAATAALFRWRFALARNRVALVIEERNRIAREWHDTLMANFAAISWQLEATQNRLRTEPPAVESSLELARVMVKHCMAQARRIIWDLRDHHEPVGLLSEELSKALSTLGPRAESDTRLQIEGSERPLPPVCVHHLVCIGQEAVTNALRHASPQTAVQVHVTYGEGRISMAIRDDGRGFELLEPAFAGVGHFGLAVMRERARKIGGDLRIQSVPGAGTEVMVSIPESATLARA
jgi:signal transduction histidine kinase